MSELEHPVVAGARRLIQAKGGSYVLEPEAAGALVALILAHANDPGLPDALRTLFGLVVVLHDELGAIDAARTLFGVLGHVQPQLRHLAPDFAALNKSLDARSATLIGTQVTNAADKLLGAPPIGAISVQSLNIPPLVRPSKARPKDPKKAPGAGQNR